jgi:hypothetical protein
MHNSSTCAAQACCSASRCYMHSSSTCAAQACCSASRRVASQPPSCRNGARWKRLPPSTLSCADFAFSVTCVRPPQSLGAPVGAALLTSLPVRGVEFVMACVLVLVIGAHCHVLQHLQRWLHSRHQAAADDNRQLSAQGVRSPATALQESSCELEQQVAVRQVLHVQQQQPVPAAPSAATIPADQELQPLTCNPSVGEPSTATLAVEVSQAVLAVPVASELHICHLHNAAPAGSQLGSSSSSRTLVDGSRLDHKGSSACSDCSDSSDEETALLLTTCHEANTSNSGSSGSSRGSRHREPSACAAAACSSWQVRWQAVQRWWADANEPEQRRATLRLLMYGSLAGSISGAMAGMTGG